MPPSSQPPRPALFRRRNPGTPWALLALITLIAGGFLVTQEKSGHSTAPLLEIQVGESMKAIDAGSVLVFVALFFAAVGMIYYSFSKLFHRKLNKPMSVLHFIATILGTAAILIVWQVLVPRSGAFLHSYALLVEASLVLLCVAQAIFLINMVWSSLRGKPA